MKLGIIDLDPRCEYILVYENKSDNTINTWTLNESAMVINYNQMKQREDIKFLGIYQKISNNQLLDILTRR